MCYNIHYTLDDFESRQPVSDTGETLQTQRQAIVSMTARSFRSHFLIMATLLGGYLTIELLFTPVPFGMPGQHFYMFVMMIFLGLVTFYLKTIYPNALVPNYDKEDRLHAMAHLVYGRRRSLGLSIAETWQLAAQTWLLVSYILSAHFVSAIGLWDPMPGFIAWPEAFLLIILLLKWVNGAKR